MLLVMLLKVFGGPEKFIIILEAGEEILERIQAFAAKQRISGFFYGLGAVRDPKIGYYDLEGKRYISRRLKGCFEVVCLVGNIAWDENGNVIVHSHICLGDREGSVYGGHLLEATVSVTLEIIVLRTRKIIRTLDEKMNLKLIAQMLD